MPRVKRTNIKRLPPIDLDMDKQDQARLWDYYQKLTETGEAARWVRDTLIAALPTQSKSQGGLRNASKSNAPSARIEIVDDVSYEDIDE